MHTLANTKERVSIRQEKYMVSLVDVKNRSYTRELPLDEWSRLAMRQVMLLTRNRVGTILDLQSQ